MDKGNPRDHILCTLTFAIEQQYTCTAQEPVLHLLEANPGNPPEHFGPH